MDRATQDWRQKIEALKQLSKPLQVHAYSWEKTEKPLQATSHSWGEPQTSDTISNQAQEKRTLPSLFKTKKAKPTKRKCVSIIIADTDICVSASNLSKPQPNLGPENMLSESSCLSGIHSEESCASESTDSDMKGSSRWHSTGNLSSVEDKVPECLDTSSDFFNPHVSAEERFEKYLREMERLDHQNKSSRSMPSELPLLKTAGPNTHTMSRTRSLDEALQTNGLSIEVSRRKAKKSLWSGHSVLPAINLSPNLVVDQSAKHNGSKRHVKKSVHLDNAVGYDGLPESTHTSR